MFWKKNKQFRLQVGEHIIAMDFPAPGYVDSVEKYFGVHSAPGKPDLVLKLNIINHEESIYVPNSIFVDKKADGGSFVFGDDIARVRFSKSGMKGRLDVKYGLTVEPLTRVFEQILYQAFYDIVKKKRSGDFLIHSSGAIYRDKAFLFAGQSGSGKSTVAKLSEDYTVLNDEICLVTKRGGEYYLQSTPFNGLFKDKKAGSAPLEAVLLLAHGKENRIIDMKKSDAAKVLAREVVPPIGLNDLQTPGIFAQMLDYSLVMLNNVTVKRMEFLPDKSFWQMIDRNFFSPDNKEVL